MSTASSVEAPQAGAIAAPRARRLRIGPVAGRRLVVWCPPVFVALLILPFLLRQNAWWEWNNPYWFVQRQAEYLGAHGTPTLFIHNAYSVFYPMPLYYGGFTFSLLGAVAVVLGAWPTFVAATASAYVAGYFGIWWTARSLGLSRALAVLPALSFVCAPYMVGTFYGRGAWAEVVALNAAAAGLGAATSLLWCPERGRRRALVALVAATAVVAGTHNLTLMLSALVLPLVLLLQLPIGPRALGRREVLRRLGRVALAVALGLGLTAAWLLPNLWFGRETQIGGLAFSQFMLNDYRPYSALDILLSPWPRQPGGSYGALSNYPQPAVLVGAWTILATLAALVLRRTDRRPVASAVGLLALIGGLVAVIADPGWWHHFPTTIQAIQMPVRLVPYVGLALAGAVVAAILALRPGRARLLLIGALVVVVGVEAGAATSIAWRAESTSIFRIPAPKHDGISADAEPLSFSYQNLMAHLQFLVVDHPTARRTKTGANGVLFADGVTSVDGTIHARGKVGDRVGTPVAWSPFVKVHGDARIAGRDAAGMSILQVTHVDAGGTWRATASPVCSGLCLTGDAPWQLTAGRLLTLLSTLAVAGFGGLWTLQALRARRARRAVRPSA